MARLLAEILWALCLVLLLQGCHQVTQKELQEKVVGSWIEVDTKNESLDFNADGTVLMQSPNTNQTCAYDFPDTQHIRFDCAAPGTPPRPQVWGVELTSQDKLLIKGNGEVGTYKRVAN